MRFLSHSALLLSSLALASPALADRVLTEDGRIINPLKAREAGGGYVLQFKHGEIILPSKKGIASVEIEGDMSDYVPKNEDEREKLEQGYVRYRGKWLSKPAYTSQLKKEFEESRERTQELAAHSDFANPWVKETKHFIVKTNNPPELLDYYCDLLEAYYKLMNKRVGIKPTPTYRRLKMTVNIYKSREEFHEWSNEVQGADIGPGVAGYFWSKDNTLNFYHDYDEPSSSEWVSLHECTHLLTFLIDQQYQAQIWVNEAVADYFGSSDIEIDDRGNIEITPGKLQTDRVLTVQQAIKDGNDIKLEDLFHITREEFHAFQYAHAWSFVYFLNNYDNGRYAKAFAKFFKELYTLKGVEFETVPGAGKTGTGKSVSPDNIRKFLLSKLGKKDTVELEEEWKTFIAAIPIEGPAARLKRGMRSTMKGEFEAALTDLNAAIESGIQDPRAYFSRGRALLWSGKSNEAVKDLEKAVEMEPLNASFRFTFSQALFVRNNLAGKPGENTEAKTQAGLAMELDPENTRYQEWLEQLQ